MVLRIMLRIFSRSLVPNQISEHYFFTSIRYNEAAWTNGDAVHRIDVQSTFVGFACHEATPMINN